MALVVKKPPANVGNVRNSGSIPGSGRSPGEGHGNPFQEEGIATHSSILAWRCLWSEEPGGYSP